MSAPAIRPGAIFELVGELDQLPSDLKLRNLEWGVIFALTGEHTAAQIGQHFNVSAQERDRAFARLAEEGLIVERQVTVDEYLRAAATLGDEEPKTLARFLRSGAALSRSAATGGAVAKSAPARSASEGGKSGDSKGDFKTAELRRDILTTTDDARPEGPISASTESSPPRAVPEDSPDAVQSRELGVAARQPTESSGAQPSTPPRPRPPMQTADLNAVLDDNLTRAVPIVGRGGFQPLEAPPGALEPDTPMPSATKATLKTPQETPAHPPKTSTSETQPSTPAPIASSESYQAKPLMRTLQQTGTQESPAPQNDVHQAPSETVPPFATPAAASHLDTAEFRRLSLKSLMRFIISRAQDPTSGQLDIYRVFIRVDTHLLKRNGITTLRFTEDRLIGDPELQQAIARSVRKSLGIDCPSQVYV